MIVYEIKKNTPKKKIRIKRLYEGSIGSNLIFYET